MVIDNQTEEPVVYSTKDEDPGIFNLLLSWFARIFFRFVGLVRTAFRKLRGLPSVSGATGSNAGPKMPRAHAGFGGSSCVGLLDDGCHYVPGTEGYAKWSVVVRSALNPLKKSNTLSKVSGDETVLRARPYDGGILLDKVEKCGEQTVQRSVTQNLEAPPLH
jgi:hypothetical protein